MCLLLFIYLVFINKLGNMVVMFGNMYKSRIVRNISVRKGIVFLMILFSVILGVMFLIMNRFNFIGGWIRFIFMIIVMMMLN